MWATVTIAETTLDPAAAFSSTPTRRWRRRRSAASACCPPICAATAVRSCSGPGRTPRSRRSSSATASSTSGPTRQLPGGGARAGADGQCGIRPVPSPRWTIRHRNTLSHAHRARRAAGRIVSDGLDEFYPEEAPVHTATVAAFAVERHPVTNAQFAEFVAATGYLTVAEQPLDPRCIPVCRQRIWRRARWCSGRRADRSTCGTGGSGGTGSRAPAGGTRSGPTARSTTGWTIRWCRSPIPTRRPMRGGPVGGCRPKRNGSTPRAAGDHHLRVGRRRRARRPADGQHLAGPVSVPQRRGARLGRHLAGRHVPAERVRSGRHDRQRVGVDDDGVLRPSPARRRREGLLHPGPRRPTRPSTRRSKAGRICARRSTATVTGRRPGPRSRRTARPPTSASAAWLILAPDASQVPGHVWSKRTMSRTIVPLESRRRNPSGSASSRSSSALSRSGSGNPSMKTSSSAGFDDARQRPQARRFVGNLPDDADRVRDVERVVSEGQPRAGVTAVEAHVLMTGLARSLRRALASISGWISNNSSRPRGSRPATSVLKKPEPGPSSSTVSKPVSSSAAARSAGSASRPADGVVQQKGRTAGRRKVPHPTGLAKHGVKPGSGHCNSSDRR